jgi:uncharacterized protein (UPF0335 family)
MIDKQTANELRSYVERIDRLEDEKATIAEDIRAVYGEAKSKGYSVKALRAIVRERRQDTDTKREFELVLDEYRAALGMLDGTPLGNAAIERAGAALS